MQPVFMKSEREEMVELLSWPQAGELGQTGEKLAWGWKAGQGEMKFKMKL